MPSQEYTRSMQGLCKTNARPMSNLLFYGKLFCKLNGEKAKKWFQKTFNFGPLGNKNIFDTIYRSINFGRTLMQPLGYFGDC